MTDILKLTEEIQFNNSRTKELFELIDFLIYNLDISPRNENDILKTVNQAQMLIYFGEHLVSKNEKAADELWQHIKNYR